MLRSYSGNAQPTTLAGGISAGATSLTVTDATGYPSGVDGPFVITVDPGLASEEKILCNTRTGNTFAVASRGWDDTSAADHGNQAVVHHTYSATDAREANEHVNDVSSPHAASSVTFTPTGTIGATDVQAAVAEVASEAAANLAAHGHDHGALTGLADDDHPQYLNTARHDLAARHAIGTVIPTAAPAASDFKATGAEGVAASVARSDHQHARESFPVVMAATNASAAIAMSTVRTLSTTITIPADWQRYNVTLTWSGDFYSTGALATRRHIKALGTFDGTAMLFTGGQKFAVDVPSGGVVDHKTGAGVVYAIGKTATGAMTAAIEFTPVVADAELLSDNISMVVTAYRTQ